jgi:hypothetical protein
MKNKLECKVIMIMHEEAKTKEEALNYGWFDLHFVSEIKDGKMPDGRLLKVGDFITGKCNNIASFKTEVMEVSDIMPMSKSVYCKGIWTDGSEMKIEASSDHELGLPLIDQDFIEAYVKSKGEIKDVNIELAFNHEHPIGNVVYSVNMRPDKTCIIIRD